LLLSRLHDRQLAALGVAGQVRDEPTAAR
ncbi:MAG: hypothetical protein QOC85_634, partial [Streptomyces sp.]|nr:hypothetical protein [Streptomyces sp.]